MQSASIASLSRLMFEFHENMGSNLVCELVDTILDFMVSKNREVVKSALGFIKVVIVVVPQDLILDKLEHLISSILTHSRNHKSHFKAKVRHIFERLGNSFFNLFYSSPSIYL